MGMLRFHCVQLASLLDVDVVYYDYGGYGASTGSPSVSGTLEDAACAAAYLEDLGIAPSRVVVYGFSLGNGPACHLAANVFRGKVRGVVLRSGFVSGVAAATDLVNKYGSSYVPAGALPSFADVWPNEKLASKIASPTLVVHGTRDELLSIWHATRLYDALPETSRVEPFIRNMGHFDVERHPEYLPRLRAFIHEETRVPPGPGGPRVP